METEEAPQIYGELVLLNLPDDLESVPIAPETIESPVSKRLQSTARVGHAALELARVTVPAVARGFKKDLADHKNWRTWPGFVSTSVMLGGVAAVGASRYPTAKAMSYAAEHYDKPLMAAAVAGIGCGLWCRFDAEVINRSFSHFRKAFAAAGEGCSKKINNILIGLEPTQKTPLESHHENRYRRLAHKAGQVVSRSTRQLPMRTGRAVTIQGAGIVSYVAAANAQQQTPEQRRRLMNNLGVDGGGFIFMVAGGMAVSLKVVGSQDPALVEKFSDLSSNQLFWMALAVGARPAINRVVRPAVRGTIKTGKQAYSKLRPTPVPVTPQPLPEQI